MRKYSLFLLALSLVASVFFSQAAPALACSCLPPKSAPEALQDAKAVFAGRVTHIDAGSLDQVMGSVNISFDVSKSWKAVDTSTLTIETPKDSAACGYAFEVGQEYLVYASGTEGTATVTLCSRTALLADASEDVAALGEGTVPTPELEETEEPVIPSEWLLYISLALMASVVIVPLSLAGISLLRAKK